MSNDQFELTQGEPQDQIRALAQLLGPDCAVIHVDPGQEVICDWCNANMTASTETGGMLFGTKGCCPACTAKMLPKIVEYGEEEFIRGRCPEGMSFADWIRSIR